MSEDVTNNNQQDPSQESNMDGSEEHETHTTALVLLAIATLAVIVVVLSVGQSVEDLNPGDYSENNQETEQMGESAGPAIPVEQVQTEEETSLSGLPEGIYLPNDREILRNYSADLTNTTSQRVVVFETTDVVPLLRRGFARWFSSSDFTVTETESSESGFTYRAENGTRQLIVGISDAEDIRRVQINVINEQ